MVPVVLAGAVAAVSDAPAVTLAVPVFPPKLSSSTESASRTLYGIVV